MTRRLVRSLAPRSATRIGAFWRPRTLLLIAGFFAGAESGAAQEPPDSVLVGPDTVLVAPDSAVADSLAAPIQPVPDSLQADTVFYNLPSLDSGAEPGWASGVWSWDHDDIMATAANTLAELFADVPGLIQLRAGDYGTPLAVTGFGVGGGGIRIFRDGFELFPLTGGVADLARIGLGGIEGVRLERSLDELRIELTSRRHDDGRPYSLVEAGTGDLGTNLFRGTFTDPTALGGAVGVALERADTRGPGGEEVGNRTGNWLRYQFHRGDRAGLALDFRTMTTETDVADYASQVGRTDWAVRGRFALAEGVATEIYTGKSTHSVDDERDAYLREGGSRSQHGLRLDASSAGGWLRAEHRLFGGGEDLPSNRTDLAAGLQRERLGGVAADWGRAAWGEDGTSSARLRAWTRPVFGLSLFGSWESGTFGSRLGPPLEMVLAADTAAADTTAAPPTDPADSVEVEPARTFGISDRTATRLGASLTLGSAVLSGALLRVEADSLIPLGIEPDRGQPFVAFGERKGWEVYADLPTGVEGLRLRGSLQQWEEAGPYLPERIYRGAFVFHRVYKESGNLEWWWSIGVRGHDPMTTPIVGEPDEEGNPTLETVPFYQDWFATMQVRVVTVRIFVKWENFSRRPNLQSFPGRVLPITRTSYGLRWTLWN